MTKISKFFEYGYLIVAIIFIVEGILRWNTDREKAYLFLGFSILAIFMYFFKKHFRKKVATKNNNQKDQ